MASAFDTPDFMDERAANLEQIAHVCHQIAQRRGYWSAPRTVAETFAYLHGQLAEGYQAYKDNEPSFSIQALADVVITILDFLYAEEELPGTLIMRRILENSQRDAAHPARRV